MPARDQFTPRPNLPLGRYRHYKGGEYEVIELACDEATYEWLVVYRALYDTGEAPSIWVRTYANFTETVDVDGLPTLRFTYLKGVNS